MGTVKGLYRLVVVFLFFVPLAACTDPEYTEIRFQEFPEQYQQYDRMPWEMFEIEDFFSAYEVTLNDFPEEQYLDDYIDELMVVSTGNRFVTTQQGDFIYIVGCKPHFCGVARVFVLFDPKSKRAWAFAYDLGLFGNFEVWLGQPDQRKKMLMIELESMLSGI